MQSLPTKNILRFLLFKLSAITNQITYREDFLQSFIWAVKKTSLLPEGASYYEKTI